MNLDPAGMSPRLGELREAVIGELEAEGRMSARLMSAVTRYARMLELAERAWAAVPKRSLLGRTDRGGQRVHPAVQVAMQAEQAAQEYGAALGLEPRLKQAPGGQAGRAYAPDRVMPGRGMARVHPMEPPRLTRREDAA